MVHITAIIGFGGMGGWHETVIREKVPELSVKGVFDIRQEALEKARERNLYVYSDLNELLDDQKVNLVIIAVPNNFHKELSVKCLLAGKNVICEKPVAMNSAELEEIMETARVTGKIFTVHQNRRWDKDYAIVKKILADNTVGKPYFIESRVQGSRGAMFGWRSYVVNGGGMTYDWGVHLIDQLLDLIPSKVVSVDAHLVSLFSGEVDDNVKILMRFENGVSAMCEFSTNCFINHPRWHVSCDNGTIAVEDWECHGRMVQLSTDSIMEWADDIVYTSAGPTRTMAPRPVQTTNQLALPEIEIDSAVYYSNVARAIEGKEELIVKPEQALRVMNVIDLVFESQRQGHGLPCSI
ncbi:MAG: Gfo/Idh/MocA family protein [Saccharofermentanales bacterium]